MNPTVDKVTQTIVDRSADSRKKYLHQMVTQTPSTNARRGISCSNLAHTLAAENNDSKNILASGSAPNIGIISSYNDMLSAHQPYYRYPEKIKSYAWQHGAVVQMAAGVPAMCDGITQGTDSMQLSLFSRDTIALATAIGLSHNVYDGVVYLGICDKIVPGMLIAALRFGHLPTMFIPSGPMPKGIANSQKAQVRQDYAAGKASRDDLLQVEMKSYHSPGTCTFYGTANSNQMLLECMGLQLPGSSFVPPGSQLRDALNEYAVHRLVQISEQGNSVPLYHILDEKALINAMVGLLATGGSTNHAIHLVAIAQAAGISINWHDFDKLARVVPLLARVYPNGSADVNDFTQAGGVNAIIGELLAAGLMHQDVTTVVGNGLHNYARQPQLHTALQWSKVVPGNDDIVRSHDKPFEPDGGLQLLQGNLGEAIMKVSAVAKKNRNVRAPAKVFSSQQQFMQAFENGHLQCDHVAVVRFQGPRANGMPELHKITPLLAVLQDKGYKVALVTDGRLSGASGKVPAAIHVTPEAISAGSIGKIQEGDIIEINSDKGLLNVVVASRVLAKRQFAEQQEHVEYGSGREMFSFFRSNTNAANDGATIFDFINCEKHNDAGNT